MRRAVALALLVAACGKQGELMPKPPPGETPKPLPGPPPSQRLIPSTQEQPARADDPLRRSEERRDDRFNLPPQG